MGKQLRSAPTRLRCTQNTQKLTTSHRQRRPTGCPVHRRRRCLRDRFLPNPPRRNNFSAPTDESVRPPAANFSLYAFGFCVAHRFIDFWRGSAAGHAINTTANRSLSARRTTCVIHDITTWGGCGSLAWRYSCISNRSTANSRFAALNIVLGE